MEFRTLDLNIISAKGLKKATLIGKMDVYAVVSISGTTGKPQKLKTHVDQDGGTDPTWNFPMKFTIDEAAGFQNRLTLVVEIKHEGTFGDKEIGEANVPIRELLDGMSKDGKSEQSVSYQIRTPSGKPKGNLNFSYKFGEKWTQKVEEKHVVTAYPAGMAVGSSSSGYQVPYPVEGAYPPQAGYPPAGYAPPPQAGYAYPQQPGYGYPPPPPGGYPPQQYGYPPVQQQAQKPKKNKAGGGLGLGAGLLGGALGGLLIADIASDAADGGGCGGGCGGF